MLVDETRRVEPGTVYIASDDADMVFSSYRTIRPRRDMEPIAPHPNIDRLFISAADYCRHTTITALLLTGMGSDGASGLSRLRAVDALTVAQEPDTCAVDSMPQSAIKSGAAQKVLSPDEMVIYLSRLLKKAEQR